MAQIVNYGVNELTANLSGKTIAIVRTLLGQPLNLDPNATVTVDGESVDESYTIKVKDETIEFAPFPSVLGVEHCAHNFKAFAGLQTFTTPLAAVTLRVYPNGD